MAVKVVVSWSGGKDSALTLLRLLGDPGAEVPGLLTTVTESYERVSMHGVAVPLLRAQARLLGLPLIEVRIPPQCSNEVYEGRMADAYSHPVLRSADAVASGDIFLEDVRAYREERIRRAGKEALFPLWGCSSNLLAEEFIGSGFRAVVCCVDPRQVAGTMCGAEFDHRLLSSLPSRADPCGENGEFHTFVYAAPYFPRAIACARGEVVERDGFLFQDLIPETTPIG